MCCCLEVVAEGECPCFVVTVGVFLGLRQLAQNVAAAEVVVRTDVVVLHDENTESHLQSPVVGLHHSFVAEAVALEVATYYLRSCRLGVGCALDGVFVGAAESPCKVGTEVDLYLSELGHTQSQ